MNKGNMTFIRNPHKSDYTLISNGVIEDKELSAKAKGILLYLLSRPDDWYLYKSKLYEVSAEGRSATDTAIKELIEKGYIAVKEKQKGRRTVLSFTVSEDGMLKTCADYKLMMSDECVDNQHRVCRKSTQPCAQNLQVLNTEINTNILTTDKDISSSISNNISVKVREYVEKDIGIKLSDNFYDRFISSCLGNGIKEEDICNYLKWIVDTRSNSVPKVAGFIYKTAGEVSLISEYLEKTKKKKGINKKTVRVICNKCGKEQSYTEKVQGYCFTCFNEHYNYATGKSEVHNEE